MHFLEKALTDPERVLQGSIHMTDRFMLSRRQLLKTSAAGTALGLASVAFPISRAFAATATVVFM